MTSSWVFAQTSVSPTQTSVLQVTGKEKPTSKDSKRLSILSGFEYSQAVAAEERGTRAGSTDLSLSIGYRTNDLTTLTAKAIASKDHAGAQNTSVSNTQIILGIKGVVFNERWTSAHSVIGLVPTNESSRKEDRLQTSLGISNGFNYVRPFITMTYRLGINKNFHEFNFNAEGKANIEYTVSNSLGIEVPIYQSWRVGVSGLYRNGWTYGGFSRSSFGVNADLIYDLSDGLSLNVGTSNEGNALKANGVDSNIAAFDDKTSVFRAGLSYVY